jgi:hypothetical protein
MRYAKEDGAERWGRCLDKLLDERGPFHLLKPDNSPACGVPYHSTTGTYPFTPDDAKRCGRCKKIAEKRSMARRLFEEGSRR